MAYYQSSHTPYHGGTQMQYSRSHGGSYAPTQVPQAYAGHGGGGRYYYPQQYATQSRGRQPRYYMPQQQYTGGHNLYRAATHPPRYYIPAQNSHYVQSAQPTTHHVRRKTTLKRARTHSRSASRPRESRSRRVSDAHNTHREEKLSFGEKLRRLFGMGSKSHESRSRDAGKSNVRTFGNVAKKRGQKGTGHGYPQPGEIYTV